MCDLFLADQNLLSQGQICLAFVYGCWYCDSIAWKNVSVFVFNTCMVAAHLYCGMLLSIQPVGGEMEEHSTHTGT